ncbi:MAG: class A beta-lactamase [Bosea sp.]|uniref:class A beta-lactamase n=1 Tax=Bosea sp. (in: a-proteobacteria) TaxID=1871050 RepID=UPI0023A41EB5|nr:class A beta-lactamase [Bosea sp. (in: a-proteobacteria)]MCP4734539.1 class A beta-lactamase [Bosea sp. (in: a-proteobacteria)]
MIRRRELLIGSLMAAPMLGGLPALAQEREDKVREALFALDRKHGGRLGVAILDSGNGRIVAHRGEERFAMCSTFKFVAAAFALARVDRGEEELERRVSYSKADLITYSPVTEKHVDRGLTVAELCDAAVTLSDNTAGNLLLDSFGGPKGLTDYMHSLGDEASRLDRREPELNEARTGDPRDTTTPVAMAGVLRQTVLGGALSPASRQQLTGWLVANKTGDKRLRAGVPKGWRIGEKTGTGNNNATNDVGVIWPPGRAPLVVTAYYAESSAALPEREAVLAEVGRLASSL